MKSLTKLDWILAGFMATDFALELLEQNPGKPAATRCLRHFTLPALAKAHSQLRETLAFGGAGDFHTEMRAVDTQLVSVVGEFGVVEVRGCLHLKRDPDSGLADTILSSVVRMRLTCQCRQNPGGSAAQCATPEFGKPFTFSEALPALRQALQHCTAPFELRITDFAYETIY